MDTWCKILNGDSKELLKTLEENSIDMCITSPPYFNLRDYGMDSQIGSENSVGEYLDNLMEVFRGVRRVLKDEGSLWVNIGDVYDDRCLMCIPDKLKIMLVEDGWICRNEIIWRKPNALPCSAKNRFNTDYEKMYFFTKSKDYYFNTQYEPCKSKPVKKSNNLGVTKYESIEQEATVRQGMHRGRGTKLIEVRHNLPSQEEFVSFIRSKSSIDEIVANNDIQRTLVEHWFRRDKSGFSYPKVEDWNKVKWMFNDSSDEYLDIDHKITDVTLETDDICKNIDRGRIKRSVWDIPTKGYKGYHYATFPTELVEVPINACCKEGGVVMDCFMGSGTVGVEAKRQNKNFIGLELNPKYCELAKERIGL